jgi:protein-S-isoprenylcysteine O-methyltransferase Ste14
MPTDVIGKIAWSRIAGIAFGVGTQLFFAVTVYYLFFFLHDGTGNRASGWLLVDCLLALQFAILHSIMLLPSSKSWQSRIVPGQFHGVLFCLTTCVGLWLIFVYWRCSATVLWDATGWAALAVRGGFYASWVMLIMTLRVTGYGYQTGWTQWLFWLRRQSLPRREFKETGLFRWFRHPVYFSFLGLIWFTPRMTADHAVLTVIWTAYIFVGSYLKDQRMAYYLGDSYREYANRVPGYPGMLFGPLGKWRSPSPAIEDSLAPGALPQAA